MACLIEKLADLLSLTRDEGRVASEQQTRSANLGNTRFIFSKVVLILFTTVLEPSRFLVHPEQGANKRQL